MSAPSEVQDSLRYMAEFCMRYKGCGIRLPVDICQSCIDGEMLSIKQVRAIKRAFKTIKSVGK